jgi:hypothetical protein
VLRPKGTDNGEQSAPTFEVVTTRITLCSETSYEDFKIPGNLSERDWPRVMYLGELPLHQVQVSVASAITSVLNLLVEARNSVVTPELMEYATFLPIGTERTSRHRAAESCRAFFTHRSYNDVNGSEFVSPFAGLITMADNYRISYPVASQTAQATHDFLARNGIASLFKALQSAYQPPLDIYIWVN